MDQRPSIRPDTVIAGKYRLLALVAEGGMGAVWRAEDLRLRANVAVKLMHFPETQNAETRARFEAEAGIAAQLRSPHVVQVFDVGVDAATNAPFIAMELLEGESLRELLARAGPLAPAAVVRIVSQVARALTRAHELGIIHRDLKPANIFLVRDGETELAKVLDFGIAKHRSRAAERGRTVTGDLLGTPMYMSPEQIVSSKDVDHHSDLWSLAVIAVECLTGKLPFDADNLPGLAMAICQGNATLPSQLGAVPPGFDDWFRRATRLQPHERFGSATQLAEELRKLCAAVTPELLQDSQRFASNPARSLGHGPPPSSVAPTSRTLRLAPGWSKLRWRLAAATALLATLLAAGYVLLGRTPSHAPPLAAALPPGALPPPPGAAPHPTAPAAPAEGAARQTSAALRPESGAATAPGSRQTAPPVAAPAAATALPPATGPASSAAVRPVVSVAGHAVAGVSTQLSAPASGQRAVPAQRRPTHHRPAPARPTSSGASPKQPTRASPPVQGSPAAATDPNGLGF